MKHLLIFALIITSLFAFTAGGKVYFGDQEISKKVIPARKDTVTLTFGVNILVPAGTLDTIYLKMPSKPVKNASVTVTTTAILTKVLWVTNGTMLNAPSTVATAGTGFRYIYYDTTTSWYKY